MLVEKTAAKDAVKVAYAESYENPQMVDGILAELRQEQPVVWVEPEGIRPFWLITTAEDLKFVETRPDLFVAEPRPTIMTIAEEQQNIAIFGNDTGPMKTVVNMDNDEHRAHRQLVQSWFAKKNLNYLQPHLRQISAGFVDRMKTMDGSCDFAQDIAFWYPLRVINSLTGMSADMDAEVLRLTQLLMGRADGDRLFTQEEVAQRLMEAMNGFMAIFNPLIEDRRANPTDDLASILANAQINGEPMGIPETLGYFLIISTAGHDTTSATLAGGLHQLIENPDQMQRLTENPELLPSAIEEMLRFVAPVKHFLRTATQDVEINGQQIKKGESLAVLFASTTRDEALFEEPHSFRIDRNSNNHLAFGTGPHLCLGMHLARMELNAFFTELLPRLNSISIAGDISYVKGLIVSGIKSMPISFEID